MKAHRLGALIVKESRELIRDPVTIALAVIMPLTFSIAAGIAIGFLAYVVIRLISGRASELNAGTLVITVFGMLWLATPLLGS